MVMIYSFYKIDLKAQDNILLYLSSYLKKRGIIWHNAEKRFAN